MADALPGAAAPTPAAVRAALPPQDNPKAADPGARCLTAWRKIDAGAAALRVWTVAYCSEDVDEVSAANVADRQLSLRGIAHMICCAHGELRTSEDGIASDSMELAFFVALVEMAEQSLWVVLGCASQAAPSNADLCALLNLALQYYDDTVAARPTWPSQATCKPGMGAAGGAA